MLVSFGVKLCYQNGILSLINYSFFLAPENITFSSVEARSMIILWDAVPCSEQNGPITGYLLYYTNTTFSDTIIIIGGKNRSYTLTELRPYTNYTVTVSAYNDAGTGSTSDNRTQETEQAGQLVYSLLVHVSYDVCVFQNLMWCQT